MRYFKRADWKFFSKILVVAVTGLGIVLTAAYWKPLADHQARHDVVLTIGAALLTAAVLGVTVDIAVKRGLTKDAFKATFGYLLPGSLRGELEWFYSLGVICEHFALTLDLVEEEGELLTVRFHLERRFRNESPRPQNALADISIDDWHFAGRPAQIHQLGYEKGNQTDEDSFEQRESYAVVRKMRTKEIRLEPQETATVWASGQQTTRRSADLTFFVRAVTIDPLVVVNTKPDNIDVNVTFASRPSDGSTEERGECRFSHRGALVPFQGLTVRWWERANTVNLEVVSAIYADALGVSADAAERLSDLVSNGRLDFVVNNATIGGDPSPGQPKILRIDYRVNGELRQNTFAEGTHVILP